MQCQECNAGEQAAVVAMGDSAVLALRELLLNGPPSEFIVQVDAALHMPVRGEPGAAAFGCVGRDPARDRLQGPAFVGERLLARTWVGEATAATWERFSEVRRVGDGKLLAQCRSVYVAMDPVTSRPRRVDAALRAPFDG